MYSVLFRALYADSLLSSALYVKWVIHNAFACAGCGLCPPFLQHHGHIHLVRDLAAARGAALGCIFTCLA